MNSRMFIKTIFICAIGLATQAFAASVEKQLFGTQVQATCNCKNAADCTCKKGECKCKKCGNGKTKVFDTLKGSNETTRLPDTARYEDARGGVFI